MLKTLGAQIREFKKDSLLTPVFMILEVFMETIIPLMMASIIDQGVEAGNIHHIYVMGAWMVVAACFSLFCGVMGGKYGARASAGFARNLRKAMYENIQSFSFSNIDKFSIAGLVTDQSDLRDVYGVFHQPETGEHLSCCRHHSGHHSRHHHRARASLFYGSFSKVR